MIPVVLNLHSLLGPSRHGRRASNRSQAIDLNPPSRPDLLRLACQDSSLTGAQLSPVRGLIDISWDQGLRASQIRTEYAEVAE
jgi:hypothetical protein